MAEDENQQNNQENQGNQQNQSKEEQIGFHKGALSTLAKERQELSKMLNVVEQLMQMHVNALKEYGIDVEKMAQEQKEKEGNENSGEDQSSSNNQNMEDMLK